MGVLIVALLFFIPILLKPPLPQAANERAGETELPDGKSSGMPSKDGPVCGAVLNVEGESKPVPIEEYVAGVLAGEMPVNFHEEALKAQAVASRTYALRLAGSSEGQIKTTTAHQVYKPEAKRRKLWDKSFAENERKVRRAVKETEGQVLVHEGELISAMFFSTSNGRTETAKNYGGTDIPYLQSVESSGEETVAPAFEDSVTLTLQAWNDALGSDWSADRFRTMKLRRNETGRVQTVAAEGFEMSGRDMRDKLGLRSTDFDVAYDPDKKVVHVFTKGFGHGVGMSQYGAEAYARDGWTAEKILSHYYSGTTIKKLSADDPACLKLP
ncbi:stage II sporulation protein D [Edaphobacillus lindanitolerans]|uniref:Stage II sporulation protein D n=1 Tax=Edaphobacillus lindanitolerans TaxID=550447 RepID=A0A1U7PM89_9BACI|nr:stage II sporulation protein D [Edaphobacillus lindanitolerans]